jgi:hypothetical protein
VNWINETIVGTNRTEENSGDIIIDTELLLYEFSEYMQLQNLDFEYDLAIALTRYNFNKLIFKYSR